MFLFGVLYLIQDLIFSRKLKIKLLLYIRFIKNVVIIKSLWVCVENVVIKLN